MDLNKYWAKPNKTLLEHTKEVREQLNIINDLGYIPSEKIYFLADRACYWHDFGKANTKFQERVKGETRYKKFDEEVEIAHNILSLYFIPKEELGEDYGKVAYAVMRHHNYCNEDVVITEKTPLIKELLAPFSEEANAKIRRKELIKILAFEKDEETIWIKGLLHRCDYSASAGMQVEYKNDFLLEKLDLLLQSWKQKKPHCQWNELQLFCKEHSNQNIIVKAQTGMGKTEAGLLWLGNNKGFFVLPIKVAINAIYDRVQKDILNNELLKERVGLLHSDTVSCYFEKVDMKQQEVSLREYYDRTKKLSMPLTITTLDQIFDFVFQYLGYEMKLVTLAYSKIVIDEIQMYGADLLAYLICGINKIVKLGGRVAILTATLPAFVHELLKEKAFEGNVIEADHSFVEEDNKARHKLKVCKTEVDTDLISDVYIRNKKQNKGNKILVICNTVKKAQEVFEKLQSQIPEEELHILHKKFIEKDRRKAEEKILEFGRTYNESGEIDIQNGIWVATSIVEASLDIDFDVLFTELLDLNSLFQRMGRCNRKGVKEVKDYNIYVFTKIWEHLLGQNGFIDRTIYDLSLEAIQDVDGILSEKRKMELVEETFSMDKVKNSKFMREFKYIYEKVSELNPGECLKEEAKLRNIVSYTIIPKSIYDENCEEIEETLQTLENKQISLEEKIAMEDKIKGYTLSVEPYAFDKSQIQIHNIFGRSNFGMISVIDCYYSEVGYKKKTNDGYAIW